jgi:endonuclease YncB( thermonuclease family)
MGKRIVQDELNQDSTVTENLNSKIGEDLGLDKTLVYRITQFYKSWPEQMPSVANTPITWTHIVELLSVKTEAERNFYLEAITKEDWDRNTLRKAIKKNYFELINTQDQTQEPKLKRDPNPLYVYKAFVEKVVDGDTLLVRIDLGFTVFTEQRIRFRGINTEEIANKKKKTKGTERATRAQAFVQDKLKDIPFVVIKTYKTDIYGRYVGDVFYHPTLDKKEDIATQGFFLNDELLKAGLADLTL